MANILDAFDAVQTTPEARELDKRIRDLSKIVFEQQQLLDAVKGQINLQIDLNKELIERIKVLEGFVSRGTWFEKKKGRDLMSEMEGTNLTAEILDAVETDFWIEGPVTGQRLRRG